MNRWAVTVVIASGALLAGCGGGSASTVTSASIAATPSLSRPDTRAATPTETPTAAVSSRPVRRFIDNARWHTTGQGHRLVTEPSLVGRNYAYQQPRLALAEALRLARPTPVHLTRSMRQSLLNQLRCHAAFAQRKPTWDLEDWRPDVGYYATIEAYCNP